MKKLSCNWLYGNGNQMHLDGMSNGNAQTFYLLVLFQPTR